MTTKHKILFVFLSIITLGIFPTIVYGKKNSKITKEELSSTNKLHVNLEKIKKNIGGLKNIVGVEFTHTKVKIFVKNRDLVNTAQLKSTHGISGVFINSGAITLIVGNSAKKVATLLSNS